MRVLFLALGGTRRHAVVAESAQVVADGGSAVVVIESGGRWKRMTFAEGVDVVALSKIEQRRPVRRAEQLVLYKGPGFLLNRVIGRGRLRPRAHRASKAYEQRIADRVHRRLFLPAYGRFFKQPRSRLVERHLLTDHPFDVLVVTDALSMPVAADLLALPQAAERVAPTVAYSIDHIGG